MNSENRIFIGIVGARGFAGAELIGLINTHPQFTLAFAASRSQMGLPVPSIPTMDFVDAGIEHIGDLDADALILAVPDGSAATYAQRSNNDVVLDLSSDHRFDDGWVYGLCEHNAQKIRGARRISNPGCYATAAQLAIRPLIPYLDETPHIFGVSGYSGAGSKPSDRNNPDLLAEGVTPYALVGHTHEREIARHLGTKVRFSPHVAPFYRGLSVTVQAHLKEPTSADAITRLMLDHYGSSRLIRVLGERVPRVQDIAKTPGAEIGGVSVNNDGRSIALVCTIDNLLKGAASQAIQNLNLAFSLPVECGLIEGAES